MSQKRLVLIIFLLVIFGGGLYLFLTKNLAEAPGGTVPSVVLYQNNEYGFNFSLPKSWEGYSLVTTEWVAAIPDKKTMEAELVGGPIISIRHPLWTEAEPRQDIPIMIFTLAQWSDLEAEKFHIGAAPINPKELGRNEEYVFALPARYNYAFPKGFEEVEKILLENPLRVSTSSSF